MTAALAGLLTAGLVVGGLTVRAVLAIAVVLVQGACAARWFATLQVPGARVGVVLVVGTGLAADLVVLGADDARPMGRVPAVLGLALLGAVAAQLVRRDGRVALTGSLVATGSAVVLAGCAAGWLALESVAGDLVLVGAVAAGSVPLVDSARRALDAPRWLGVLGALVLAVGAAIAVAASTDLGRWPALGCAGAAAIAARVAAVFAERAPGPSPVLTASFPLVLAAPAAYIVGRVLVG